MNTSILKNKTVVITGGAGGLGSAFSLAVAKEGARVVILGRNLEKAQLFADSLTSQGFQALAVSADVTHEESLKIAADLIINRFGSIDILINNAGGNHPDATTEIRFAKDKTSDLTRDFFKMKPSAMTDLFQLNFIGTLLPTQVFASYMKKDRHPCIINISSMSAFKPLTKIPAYSAAKAAINNLTQWLAVYFASSGIRVNAIAPGFFQTDQNKQLLKNPDGSLTDRSKLILEHTPMGRFGEAEELLGTLLWLVNHESSGFVTGVIIPVDGGFSAFGGI
jgi:NAD(P)-dependent dehydrogenase (short-subunit alcohol dehydrogenase family)